MSRGRGEAGTRLASGPLAPQFGDGAYVVGEGFTLQNGMALGTHRSFPSEEGMGTTASRDACATKAGAATTTAATGTVALP